MGIQLAVLYKALGDPDREVRISAAIPLARLIDKVPDEINLDRVVPFTKCDLEVRMRAVAAEVGDTPETFRAWCEKVQAKSELAPGKGIEVVPPQDHQEHT